MNTETAVHTKGTNICSLSSLSTEDFGAAGRSEPPRLSALSAIAMAFILFTFASCSGKVESTGKALVFGINQYENIRPILSYCVSDADSMSVLLGSRGFDLIEKGVDSDATKEKIRTAIVSSPVSPDSTLVFYFSGHGAQTGDDVYIIPQDASWNSSTWISPTELASWLAESGTDRIIVILDACNSGGFTHGSDSLDTSPERIQDASIPGFPGSAISRFGDLLALNIAVSGQPAPIVLSASGAQEESYESWMYLHGVFTYFLMESATSGDRNADGMITAMEAFTYARTAVESKWNTIRSPFLPRISGGSRDLLLFGAR